MRPDDGEGAGANLLAGAVAARSRRTRAALAAKAARGERIGTVPYGFRVCSDAVHLEQEPAEQAVIATARRLRAFGLTLRAIIADLESRGMRNRKGRPFSITAVHKMTGGASDSDRSDTSSPGILRSTSRER